MYTDVTAGPEMTDDESDMIHDNIGTIQAFDKLKDDDVVDLDRQVGYIKKIGLTVPYGTKCTTTGKQDPITGKPAWVYRDKTGLTISVSDCAVESIEEPEGYEDHCKECNTHALMWRATDWQHDTNDEYYDKWDQAVDAFLACIQADPTGNYSIYASGICNCGNIEHDEGVVYNFLDES